MAQGRALCRAASAIAGRAASRKANEINCGEKKKKRIQPPDQKKPTALQAGCFIATLFCA
jgi:hypothetical protein